MFIVDVKVDLAKAKAEQMQGHMDYCHREFENGNIVMCGPSITYEARGIIIFKAKSAEDLEKLLKADPLYDAAEYDIHEFKVNAVAKDIQDY